MNADTRQKVVKILRENKDLWVLRKSQSEEVVIDFPLLNTLEKQQRVMALLVQLSGYLSQDRL